MSEEVSCIGEELGGSKGQNVANLLLGFGKDISATWILDVGYRIHLDYCITVRALKAKGLLKSCLLVLRGTDLERWSFSDAQRAR